MEKKEARAKKPSASSASLSAAAAMMGKQRLSSMFTSSVFKKTRDEKVGGLSCDSIVDDVIAEFAPDEADRERERRRRGQSGSLPAAKVLKPVANVRRETVFDGGLKLLDSPDLIRNVTNGDSGLNKVDQDSEEVKNKDQVELENGNDLEGEIDQAPFVQSPEPLETISEDKKEKVIEAKVEPVVKKDVTTLNAKINKEEKDPALSATAGWQAVRNGGAGDASCATEVSNTSNSEDSSDFDLEGDGVLPFYMIDAHEEFYGANMGTLYLFGKVIRARCFLYYLFCI